MHMHFTFVRAGLIRFASYTETLFLETFRLDWLDIGIQYHIIYKTKEDEFIRRNDCCNNTYQFIVSNIILDGILKN